MSEKIITSDNYETEVLHASLPVLLDFNATWCGPCRMIAPFIAQIAEECEGKLTVGKIDTDDEPQLAAAFDIQFIPTLVIMKDGKPVDKLSGYHTREEIVAWVEKSL